MSEVSLVSMPFGPHIAPSIGLSLLRAQLRSAGIDSEIHYFSIEFAELIGESLYYSIATDSGHPSIRELAGEWLFRDALFETECDSGAYVEEILRQRRAWPRHACKKPLTPAAIRRILSVRDKIGSFLDRCCDRLLDRSPRIVGFTSVFQQHVASLALARRIKRRAPDTFIVFGGANCEGLMGAETVRQFPFVDAAISGEGDLLFPELVRRVLGGDALDGLSGIRTPASAEREIRSGSISNAPMVIDMDALAVPSYDDFFEKFNRSRLSRRWEPALYFESSRGCWWGERSHCTFCGLNGVTMKYRSKSAERALGELVDLARRHPGCDIQVTDNILDMSYFDTFVPALAGHKLKIDLFYETKSNLKKTQIRALRDAGITRIQPGIESFSDPVLKLMRKGVSALQNIQLLKWCKELGVKPFWNFLWGFPGEEPEEYHRMAKLIPRLRHLQAPMGVAGIRLDRFSPSFVARESLGFANVRPLAPYRHIYPFPDEVVQNLAYYFDFDYAEPQMVASYAKPLQKALSEWQRAGEAEDLLALDDGSHLCIWDLRKRAAEPLTTLRGLDRFLYRRCDAATGVQALASAACDGGFDDATESLVVRRLSSLEQRGLMVEDGGRYLALAIIVGEYQPCAAVLGRLRTMARLLGRRTAGGVVVPLAAEGAARRKSIPVAGTRTVPRRMAVPSFFVNDGRELVIQF
ncbi:MAG TPA: RiPP maturation radical SAM C-methyltransferase [Thermoanaerobaculia bacterium]|nr:RiPP maturation radical SAM C-methyltransferase [Thermoanaerobaculia bacterium]